ncbi:MAG: hypothetical protein ACYCZS_11020 [Thiobacillus sp.]
MTPAPLVLVGAAGWAHPAWRARFYPDDMPDDWMLSYYNTQFSAVYLPAAVWQTASGATWAQWLHDTLDGFCFVLEPGDTGALKPVSERVVLATPAWEAGHVWWLDEAPDLRSLAQRITRQAATGEPLFVFSRSGNLALMEQANTLRQVMGY